MLHEEENLIRRYLLGAVTDEEQQRVEEQLLENDEYAARVQLIEEELIDDYARGALSAEERGRFEQSFLSTPKRRQKLALAESLVAYAMSNQPGETTEADINMGAELTEKQVNSSSLPPGSRAESWWRAFFFPPWKLAVYAVLVLGIGLGLWQWGFGQSDLEKAMVALNQAYREQRPIEARISGLHYAPYVVTRSNEQNGASYRELDEAEILIRKTVREKGDAASLHALGKLYLTKKEFDKAIEQLELALKTDAQNARLHSDLGIALLEKSRVSQRNNPQQYALEIGRALDELNKAVLQDGTLLEAIFNRALCRHLMGLPHQAEEGWNEYLQKDANSPWAEEARQYLKELKEQKEKVGKLRANAFDNFVNAYESGDEAKAWEAFTMVRSRTVNAITDRLLDNWLMQKKRHQPLEAERQLRLLEYAGRIETRRTGDRYTSALATYYRIHGDQHPATIDQARQVLKQAADKYSQSQLQAALNLYQKAATLFHQIGDECEAWLAESWAGYCRVRLFDLVGSKAIFDKLVPIYQARDFKCLLAYAFEATADIYVGRNDLSRSLEKIGWAEELARQIGDWPCSLRSQNQLSSINRLLGRYEEALEMGLQGLHLIIRHPVEPRQSWSFYSAVSLNLLTLEMALAASDVQQEASYIAMVDAWPLYQSFSYIRQGMIQAELGKLEEAVRYADLSLEEAGRITDEASKTNSIANILVNKGHLLRRIGNHQAALLSYEQAIALYARTPLRFFSYQAHEGSFLSRLVLNDEPGAARDIEEVSRLLENYRRQILAANYRDSLADESQLFYDAAINFEYTRRHNSEAAFQLSESSRARSLLAAKQGAAKVVKTSGTIDLEIRSMAVPFRLAEIRQRLPAQTRIVHYAVLDDKVIAWVIGCDGVFPIHQNVSAKMLAQDVTDFTKLVAGGSVPPPIALAKKLHDILIKPLEQYLHQQELLCLIPDKELHFLPFAALVSAETERYFIEDHTFVTAPSATAFILCSEAASKKNRQEETFLGMGNPPSNSEKDFPLPDLEAAATEVEQISALYHAPVTLIGAQAKESAFRKNAPSSDVIHIASHSIAEQRSPLLSRLLLAADTTETSSREEADGVLHAYELYQLKLPRTRLVVLAACQTGVGRAYRGEGVMNLARPFLVAGVPLIVASLWEVKSAPTRDLMASFHRHRRHERQTIPAALRAAQLESLRHNRSSARRSSSWASFTVIGGASAY